MTTTVRSTRPGWSSLPLRRPPRRRPPIFTLRVPISRRATWILATASIAVPLLAWWIVSANEWIDQKYLPTPAASIASLIEMVQSGQIFDDAWISIQRVLWGFGLAVACSVPIGLLMGSFRAGWALIEPLLGLLRYLPPPAFMPLLLGWLGLEEEPKISLIFIATFFFNTLMTADVVRNVPANLIDVSYTLGARTGEVLRKVIIPYSLPGIIDAIRVNAAAAWAFLVVAELIASESGLGFRISRLARFLHYDGIFAVLIVIGLIGAATDILLRVLRDRIGRWV